ncbi:THAP domain-containing protein 9, partial [Trachymyrmex cornetzi]
KRHLRKKAKGAFPVALKNFAATLQFYSTKAYEYVRKTFLNILPHPQTIRRWYASIDCKPGITTEALKTIQAKIHEAASDSKTLNFSLTIDDMSIRQYTELVNDQYYGYVDYEINYKINSENNDNLLEATSVCVFLLVCINGNWKIPVAYYVIRSLSRKERANLIKIVLGSLHKIGAVVVNITMDGCASNISTMNYLGANISAENLISYFMHPISKEKVYLMLDACHMIKLIRNTYDTKRNIHDSSENKIEWRYIVNLIELQEREGLHTAVKINRRHLNWQREKMNVQLAVQIFSNSVANAIDFCRIDLKLQQFDNSTATSLFIRNMNNIFDLLNSRNLLCKNESQQPISLSNIDRIKENITKYIEYINDLYIDDKKMVLLERKIGFLGMLTCLQSIKDIAETLIATKKQNFLLTYKMSQDHLEMFFSAIRTKGGHNNNPSARQFSYAYRRLLHHTKLTVLPHGNAIAQDDTNILNITNERKTMDFYEDKIVEDINKNDSENKNENDCISESNVSESDDNIW